MTMRTLFEVDYKNYRTDGTVGKRPSARAIIIKDEKIAMVYSDKYDYYKFPGGGVEQGEDNVDAMIREVKEETGLEVIPDSVREYGVAIRKEKGKKEDLFLQENYYYLCRVGDKVRRQKLDEYESEERFTLRWTTAKQAIETNLYHDHFGKDSLIARHMMEREVKVLRMLIDEGLIRS